MPLQDQIEHLVETDENFNMSQLAGMVWPIIEELSKTSTIIASLRYRLGSDYQKLSNSSDFITIKSGIDSYFQRV